MVIILVITYMVIRLSVCEVIGLRFNEESRYSGDKCTFQDTNTVGVCRPITDCSSNLNLMSLDLCGFEGSTPIVCCDQSVRTSSIKCNDYKELSQPPKLPFGSFAVVGGVNAKPAEFPHMVLIGWKNSDDITEWKCGGTLISETFIITAAHCSSDQGVAPTRVQLGGHDLLTINNEFNFDQYEIKQIVIHPNYTRKLTYNDIALFELDGLISLGKAVRPACLWQKYEIVEPSATATGWGKLEYAGAQATILQKVELFIFSNVVCNESYPISRKLPLGIIDSQVCYGNSEGGKDTCQGDSGGPIQIKTDYNYASIYHITGITSFGSFCGSAIPGVYTRIFSYLDWIESVVWPQ